VFYQAAIVEINPPDHSHAAVPGFPFTTLVATVTQIRLAEPVASKKVQLSIPDSPEDTAWSCWSGLSWVTRRPPKRLAP
jgi:hypothetical protein